MYDKIRKLLPVLSKTASSGYISELKKADTEVSAAINLSAERLFNCFNYCLECFRLVHRQIGHNLAVEGDALGVDFADKLRIGHSLRADCGVDTRDPQRTERPLLELTVCIGIAQTLLDRIFRNGPNVSP